MSERKATRVLSLLAFSLAPMLFLTLLLLQFQPFAGSGAHRWISTPALQIISEKPLLEHFAAVVGLPMAAVLSLWVVAVLRAKSGPIEFSILGFRLRGAAGPVVMWVLCFLSITFSIKLLW